MSVYSVALVIYRQADRALLKYLPGQDRLRAGVWHVARRIFPAHVKARYASEYAMSWRGRAAMPRRVPAWARAEIAELAQYEPLLAALVDPRASVEPYVIPWSMNYVGRRYAEARRQLHGKYACLALSGAGACAVDMVMLASVPRPLAIIDVVGDANLATLAHAAGADYVALPPEHLDGNDHCALLARLVLQLAPTEVLPTPHPLVARCVERHGRAMASVSRLRALPVPDSAHVTQPVVAQGAK